MLLASTSVKRLISPAPARIRQEKRFFRSIRSVLAEFISNRFNFERVATLGPDLACLEWLMECGATKVEMSDGTVIKRISEMKSYIKNFGLNGRETVDASDSAISDSGFLYFRECYGIEELILNFCDYFGDEAIRILATGRTAYSLKNLEIVMNPCVSDVSIYWIVRMKKLRRIHMYFLPYISNPVAASRHLKLALPKCNVTFPSVGKVGFGYGTK
ncbi:unnamed protein product [Enterobius vermicularis]|uniref:ATP synthase subunit s, mitochondrial n=1 Tax=Enterobius vermicularis TaxID=51028 RepID=A0A0N4VLB1_ENTVE|nr:unnamed protein product [Enterobius vermicularis]